MISEMKRINAARIHLYNLYMSKNRIHSTY